MRRSPLVPLLITVALIAAACGGGGGGGDTDEAGEGLPPCPLEALEDATGPVEIVVWHTQGAKPGQTLTALTEQYNASQSKVRVRLESQGASYDELQRKFEAAVATRQLPDLIVFDDTSVQFMADSGVVLPAQSCVEADDYPTDQFREVAVNYYTIDGVLWPVSANLGNVLLFYNKNHFRAAGLDPEDPPETLAEVREAAERIKAAGVVDTPVVHELSAWKTEFWLTGARAPVVDNDNGRGDGETTAGALDPNPAALELFRWFDQMQADGLLTAVPSVEGQIDQFLAMANQKASMVVESSSAATSVEAFLGGDTSIAADAGIDETPNLAGLDIGAGVFPGLDEPGRTQMGGAAWYLLSTSSPAEQAASWDFAKFLNSVPSQVRWLTGGSFLPYTTAAAADPEAVAFFDASLSGRWLRIANDQIDAIDPSFPGPLIGPYYDFRRELERAQDELMFGDATPEKALAQAQQGVTAALERYAAEGF
jgi:sn-glycerol 3-phosphate transport system substrate-binding protein